MHLCIFFLWFLRRFQNETKNENNRDNAKIDTRFFQLQLHHILLLLFILLNTFHLSGTILQRTRIEFNKSSKGRKGEWIGTEAKKEIETKEKYSAQNKHGFHSRWATISRQRS